MSKKEYQERYRKKNRAAINEQARQARRGYKKIVLERYGTSCVLCGFEDNRALQIDHINNNGAEERKALGGQKFSGYQFYKHLIDNNLPEGYQTLCANCNMIKHLGPDFNI